MAERKDANITVVYSEGLNYGQYENGTYDGLLGLIYNNEADTAVIPGSLEADSPPGNFGPVICSADVYIYTFVNPSNWQSVNFLSCLNIFDTAINSLIMLALISIGFLLVKHYKRQTFLVLLANALKQSFSTVEALGFLPHLSMLLGILLVQALYGSLFSTNSWIEMAPKKVDTLEDLVIQGKQPIFYKTGPVYPMFKNEFSQYAKKVWKRAQRVGLSKCLLNSDQLAQMATEGRLTPDKAFIVFDHFEAFISLMACQYYEKQFKKGFRLHASKPVHSGLWAFLRNPRLSHSDAQRVDSVFYNLFEFGYLQNYLHDYRNNPPIDARVVSPKCRREIFKAKALNELESDIKLTLSEVGQALTIFLGILIVLSALFVIEILRGF